MKKFKKGEYPEQWYCQMTHYEGVGEYDRVYLAVLIGGREFKWFVLERDDGEIEALMAEEKIFWNEHVKKDVPPPIDYTPSSTSTLKQIFAESKEDADISLLAYESDLQQYMDLGQQIKSLIEIRDGMANKVKAFMGEAQRGESAGYKVSWISTVRDTFDTKAFAADYPGLDLSKYYKSSACRTFKVTEKQI